MFTTSLSLSTHFVFLTFFIYALLISFIFVASKLLFCVSIFLLLCNPPEVRLFVLIAINAYDLSSVLLRVMTSCSSDLDILADT